MGSEYRYRKADAETSKKIGELMNKWVVVLNDAKKIAREIGADTRSVITSSGFSRRSVAGFVFKDESKVDPKRFCRLKGTEYGWKPRANSGELNRRFKELQCDSVGDVMNLIGMKLFGKGMSVRNPGIEFIGEAVYLVTPSDVNAKGCTRISDIEYESATTKKRKKAVPQ